MESIESAFDVFRLSQQDPVKGYVVRLALTPDSVVMVATYSCGRVPPYVVTTVVVWPPGPLVYVTNGLPETVVHVAT